MSARAPTGQAEARVIAASFNSTVRAIADAKDAERALQFLTRLRRLIDVGFKFELRADLRAKSTE